MESETKLCLRWIQEKREHDYLSQYACFSDCSKGRDKEEEPCDIRPVFQRDRDRILHCKSFRRLKHKTQVFLEPEGDHYRTRLTHTLEVAQIARTIARALQLNEDLTEAIALGHDLGHTPFGHAGERVLNRICKGGFQHNLQSIRVVELLEKNGRGLNLTKEVKDGIMNHQSSGNPCTLEGKIVKLADKIAYVNSDIEDSIRGKIIYLEDIPKELTHILGDTKNNRLDNLIHDIVTYSMDQNEIVMSDRMQKALLLLRGWLFDHVYTNQKAKGQETKAENLLEQLFLYYTKHSELLPEEYIKIWQKGQDLERVVCDYIAGMTDRYAIAKYREYMIPSVWSVL